MAKLAKDTSRKADVIEEQITFDKSKFKVRFIDKVVDKSKRSTLPKPRCW